MDLPPEPPPPQERIIEYRLIECGLDSVGISIRYEEYLQSIEIVIQPDAGVTSDHFECIKDAVGYEIVTFEDLELGNSYREFVSERMRPQLLATCKADLIERGLLEGFPERRNYESLDAYLRALEEHSGVSPGTALRGSGDDIIFDPPRDEIEPLDHIHRYSDLLAVVRFVSVRDRVSFGFIGNEKVQD